MTTKLKMMKETFERRINRKLKKVGMDAIRTTEMKINKRWKDRICEGREHNQIIDVKIWRNSDDAKNFKKERKYWQNKKRQENVIKWLYGQQWKSEQYKGGKRTVLGK